jgi:hypothetical protein
VNAVDRHCSILADLLRDGEVIPFLGAGANLCDRPKEAVWQLGRFPPSGGELAKGLAERSQYPLPDDLDLLRVSQYVDATLGEGQLYRFLHATFDADYPPTSLHRLVARVPAVLRERERLPLVVLTTNYDDLVERALTDEGEQFDVLWYEAKRGPLQGRFFHRSPDGGVVPVERPNKYTGLVPGERTVVLKLHGAIDRGDSKRDSYVITEDSYIDYLAGRDVGQQIPVSLRERMADSHFLFLGYSMRDWNLRVILSRIWGGQQLDMQAWSVQREPATPGAREVEEALWHDRDVDLLYIPLGEYVARLEEELFPPRPPTA